MKKFNAKQFLINHSEKLALGVFGLVALWALASANWATYGFSARRRKRSRRS